MRKAFLFAILTLSITVAQSQKDKLHGLKKLGPKINDTLRLDSIVKPDSPVVVNIDKTEYTPINNNIDQLVRIQKENESRQKRNAMIRIGIGVAMAIVLVIGLRRRRKK